MTKKKEESTRPPKYKPTTVIHVRVTDEERRKIERSAKILTGGNVGEYIRRAVLNFWTRN